MGRAESNVQGSSGPIEGARFVTTRWSVVLAAAAAPGHRREAMEGLCRTYWYPLYAYIRRGGHDADRAQDLIQSFFARFIEKGDVASAERGRGRFRSFLLGSLKHFLANEWDRSRAAKRGGGRAPLSIDADLAEKRYAAEPYHEITPERVYERRWAITLLGEVFARLRSHYATEGREQLFDRLKPFITAGDGATPHAEVAGELGMTHGAVKVAVHRLRRRYAETLRAAVADTVQTADDVEDELKDLFRSVSR